jgi:hypothetical protein
MNQDLAIAFNRAKYFNKKVIIEYRLQNNSIYQSQISYREADSLEDFKERMIKTGTIISYAKVYSEVV